MVTPVAVDLPTGQRQLARGKWKGLAEHESPGGRREQVAAVSEGPVPLGHVTGGPAPVTRAGTEGRWRKGRGVAASPALAGGICAVGALISC